VSQHPSSAGTRRVFPCSGQHSRVGGVNYPHGSCSKNKWILSVQVFSRPNSNQREQSPSYSYDIQVEKNHATKNIKNTVVPAKKYFR